MIEVDYNKDLKNTLNGFPSKCSYIKSYKYHWRQRLLCQAKSSLNTYFITLTFDEHSIMKRISSKDFENLGVRDFKEIQRNLPSNWLIDDNLTLKEYTELQREYYSDALTRFLKRWRISLSRKYVNWDSSTFKFFATSESGDALGRMHFHILAYNLPVLRKTIMGIEASEVLLEADLAEAWHNGFVELLKLDDTTLSKHVNYITKYMFKRFEDRLTFTRKSRSIGLGYFDKERRQFHLESMTSTFHIDGREYYMGRFFKQKIFGYPSEKYEELKVKNGIKYMEILCNSETNFLRRKFGCDVECKIFKDEQGTPIDIIHWFPATGEIPDKESNHTEFLKDLWWNNWYTFRLEEKKAEELRGFKIAVKLNTLRKKYLEKYGKKI